MSPSTRSAATRAPSARPARRSESLETQTRILDAAQALFVELGFAATSVRAIATRAGVNLAAAHYHFGSKEGLFGAAFHRAVAPLNEARLRTLDALEARDEAPSVREIVEAFLEPLSSVAPDSATPRLVGRLFGEPHSVSLPLIEREFSEVAARFLAALGAALPDVPPATLGWRFHFVIGSMIHLLAFEKPPIQFGADVGHADGVAQLIDFAVSGLDPQHAGNLSRRTP